MPQLKLKLTLDKRLTLGQQRRRYKKLVKRHEKQVAYNAKLREKKGEPRLDLEGHDA